MDHIDDQVLSNILKRLSAEEVFSCIFLCKRWYRVIQNPYFIKEEHLQLQRPHGLLIQTMIDSQTPHDTRIVSVKEECSVEKKIDSIGQWVVAGSCNGLLLLVEWSDSPSRLRITNPITKFTVSLPAIYPIGKHYNFSFAYVPSTRNYCVLYIYTCDENSDSKNVEFQILEVKDGQNLQELQWEKVQSDLRIFDFNFEDIEPGLYLDRGLLVWNVGERGHCVVMDLAARRVDRLILPEPINNDDDRFYLVNKGGSMAFIDYPSDSSILRILSLGLVGTQWNAMQYFSVTPLRDLLGADVDDIVPVYISENGDVVIFFCSDRYFECYVRTGEIREISLEGTKCLSFFTHIETLVSLNSFES